MKNRLIAMARSHPVVCASLVLVTVVTTQSVAGDSFVIEGGPARGSRVTEVNLESSTRAVVQKRQDPRATSGDPSVGGHGSVELSAFRAECVVDLGETNRTMFAYLMKVQAPGPPVLDWSCWTPDFPIPHRFQVFAGGSGTNYASYVRQGVHLLRLSRSRACEVIRQQFWQHATDTDHPDALPLLDAGLLQHNLGWTNTLGLGPQRLDVSVDHLSDRTGELQVVEHGSTEEPKCTFALRGGKWTMISTSWGQQETQ